MPGSTAPVAAVHPWVAEAARRVRFGAYYGLPGEWEALRGWAQTAAGLGFDSLWIADHPMLGAADCWTTLAALASHTTGVRLGPLVSCVYYRPPALLARMAADVDRMSGGRLVLGLGTGSIPREFGQLGLEEPPFGERTRALTETVGLVRALWRGEAVTVAGAHVRATGAKLASLPVQTPHVPLLIAGGGERVTLRQVAQHADMCNFGPSGGTGSAWTAQDVRRKLAALRRHCEDVGRPYDAVLRSYVSWVVIGGTEAEVDAALARRGYAAQAAEAAAAREPGMPRLVTIHQRIPSIEHLARVVVAGTPDQLVAYYRALVEAGIRYFIVGCGPGEADLRLLAAEVAARVN